MRRKSGFGIFCLIESFLSLFILIGLILFGYRPNPQLVFREIGIQPP